MHTKSAYQQLRHNRLSAALAIESAVCVSRVSRSRLQGVRGTCRAITMDGQRTLCFPREAWTLISLRLLDCDTSIPNTAWDHDLLADRYASVSAHHFPEFVACIFSTSYGWHWVSRSRRGRREKIPRVVSAPGCRVPGITGVDARHWCGSSSSQYQTASQ